MFSSTSSMVSPSSLVTVCRPSFASVENVCGGGCSGLGLSGTGDAAWEVSRSAKDRWYRLQEPQLEIHKGQR